MELHTLSRERIAPERYLRNRINRSVLLQFSRKIVRGCNCGKFFIEQKKTLYILFAFFSSCEITQGAGLEKKERGTRVLHRRGEPPFDLIRHIVQVQGVVPCRQYRLQAGRLRIPVDTWADRGCLNEWVSEQLMDGWNNRLMVHANHHFSHRPSTSFSSHVRRTFSSQLDQIIHSG